MNFDSRIAFEPLLNVACKNVSVETLQTLVEKAQLDVNCTDSYGVTPLMIAAESRDSDIVMYLLDKGAAPNASDKSGKTVFEYARTNRNLAGTEGYRTLNSLRK